MRKTRFWPYAAQASLKRPERHVFTFSGRSRTGLEAHFEMRKTRFLALRTLTDVRRAHLFSGDTYAISLTLYLPNILSVYVRTRDDSLNVSPESRCGLRTSVSVRT
jgi:hypothetical protein